MRNDQHPERRRERLLRRPPVFVIVAVLRRCLPSRVLRAFVLVQAETKSTRNRSTPRRRRRRRRSLRKSPERRDVDERDDAREKHLLALLESENYVDDYDDAERRCIALAVFVRIEF